METSAQTATDAVKPVKDFNTIVVTLTFEDYEPMVFKFRRTLNEELKAKKQAFFALTEAERDEAQNEFRRTLLAGCLIETPKNVPNYEELGLDIEGTFNEFFSKAENEELLEWVYTTYYSKLYPKELMSRASE